MDQEPTNQAFVDQNDGNYMNFNFDETDFDGGNTYCWTRSSDGFSPYTYSTYESSSGSVATEMSAFDRAKRIDLGHKIASIADKMKRPRSDSTMSGGSKTAASKKTGTKSNSQSSLKEQRSKGAVGLAQIKDIWIETCDRHTGNLININHCLPPPCNLCKASDGHGQKGRAFRVPKLYEVFGNDIVTGTVDETKMDTDVATCDLKEQGTVQKPTLLDRVKAVFHATSTVATSL